jgi:hypothetical protein
LNNLTIDYYCRLQIINPVKLGYLIVPYKKEKINIEENNDSRYDFCSLDPGTRTFQTH